MNRIQNNCPFFFVIFSLLQLFTCNDFGRNIPKNFDFGQVTLRWNCSKGGREQAGRGWWPKSSFFCWTVLKLQGTGPVALCCVSLHFNAEVWVGWGTPGSKPGGARWFALGKTGSRVTWQRDRASDLADLGRDWQDGRLTCTGLQRPVSCAFEGALVGDKYFLLGLG